MTKKTKPRITLTVITITLALCSSTPAGTGTKDDPVLMVVIGEFTKAKMVEALVEIDSSKKYVILDLSPMTGDIFDLNSLHGNGEDYIVSLKLPGVTKTIANYDKFLYGRFPSLTNVTIGDSITSIGEGAFRGCSGLASITIPNSVKSIGSYAFNWCTNLTAINVDVLNTAYSSQNGVLYNKAKTTLVKCPGGKTGTFTIPNSVTSIGNYAFHGCTSLTSITIPNSITSIGEGAFWGCVGLTNVTIPGSVTKIEENAFHSCTGFTNVIIPNSVTNIGSFAFLLCTGLTSVTIPNNVITIGIGAFSNCTNLASVTFQGTIPSSSFSASSPFLGDLRAKFYATNPANGTPGTYITTTPVSSNSVWTKQP